MSEHNSRGRANMIIGIALVGLGALFLLTQVLRINFWQFFWPFFIIVPGLLFFVGMVVGGKAAGPLAIPGSIVTMVGLILLYQSIFNHWESWAYAWSLIFPTSVGIGLAINGAWSGVPELTNRGMGWASAGVIIFLVAGAFFELLLNISNNPIGNIVWPGLLILIGGYLLMRRGRGSKSGSNGHREGISVMEEVSRPVEKKEPKAKKTEVEFEPLDVTRGKKKSE